MLSERLACRTGIWATEGSRKVVLGKQLIRLAGCPWMSLSLKFLNRDRLTSNGLQAAQSGRDGAGTRIFAY